MGQTFASITDKVCECGTLERIANDPDNPIVFDGELNEYHLEYNVNYGEEFSGTTSKAKMMIYHCPFCGGMTPQSQRELLFTQITEAERTHLQQLAEGINSLDDVIAKFGEPDQDYAEGFGIDRAGTGESPPRTESYRTLVYNNLSETSEAWFVEFSLTQIHLNLQGKYIGD